MKMQPYLNLQGDSGVAAYAIGDGVIHVRFVDDRTYEYTDAMPGRQHVRNMQELARLGRGLSTYISKFVRGRYTRKLN